jgi:transposase
MKQSFLVPDSEEVTVESVRSLADGQFLMVLRAAPGEGFCPRCHRLSFHVHSHYLRHLSDLPWEGIPVQIQLHVRRFFCRTEGCEQVIFTERLPRTVLRYARRTCRLSKTIRQITMALGGEGGSRLAHQLGINASGDTFLRELRQQGLVISDHGPRVLGVDDWAWRKGQRYGTILCDLEQHKVIDLLPLRSEASTEEWIRQHPGIEIVSRDRACLYAEAATKAAPEAIQVADRWHLLHNLSETLADVLTPHHRLLTEVSKAMNTTPAAKSDPEPTEAETLLPTRSRRNQQRKKENREQRLASYSAAMEMLHQGMPQTEVARRCKLGVRTIRRWQRAQYFPERKVAHRKSGVDAHAEYLHQRWNDGCHNAARLWRELCQRGYTGQTASVRIWIRRHCRVPQTRGDTAGVQTEIKTAIRASPRHTAWWILKEPECAKTYLDELYRRSAQIAQCAKLAREFCQIIRNRDVNAWMHWREEVKTSMLAGFAKGLCRDEAAFMAALQQPWSNGQVEGQNHRLKLIKRSMYGRAKFDLLRLRVVTAA